MSAAKVPASRAARVYAWFAPGDARHFERLRAALTESDIELLRYAPGKTQGAVTDTLAIFVSRPLLEATSALDETVANWPGTVVPISLDQTSPDDSLVAGRPLAEVSWVLGEDEALERLAVSARTSPAWLLAWDRLQRGAQRYAAEGAPLMSRRELDVADDTIAARPRRLLPSVPAEVLGFVAASRRSANRRLLAFGGIAAAVILVLLASGVVALVQRQSATSARDRAEKATVRATANRLSRISRQYLRSDPDVPVLLSRAAYEMDPSESNRNSLRRALDAVPWHQSIRLRRPAVRIAASPAAQQITVVMDDGSVDLYGLGRPARTGTIPAREGDAGAPAAAYSAGGELALAYDDGLIVVHGPTSASVRARIRASGRVSQAMAWVGDRLFTAWRGGRLTVTDVRRNSTSAVQASAVGVPKSLALSPDGRLLAVGGHDGLTVLRTQTRRPCGAPRVPGLDHVSFSSDGARLLLAPREGVTMNVPVPRGCGGRAGAHKRREWPAASPGTAVTALPRSQAAIGRPDGDLVVQRAGADYPSYSFKAHTGVIRGVALARTDRIATVGADGWLRIWSLPNAPVSYPAGEAVSLFGTLYGNDAVKLMFRPMLALDRRGSMLTLGAFESGFLVRSDASDLDRDARGLFVGINASILPIPDGCGALVTPPSGVPRIVRCDGPKPRVSWTRPGGPLPRINAAAVSGDGNRVAISDGAGVESTDVRSGARETARVHGIAAMAYVADQLVLVDGDGEIVRLDPGGRTRRTRIDLGGDSVRAAGIDSAGRRALALTSAGSLLVADAGNGSVLARPAIETDLRAAIAARFSSDGRRAVVIARDGFTVLDLEADRVLADHDGTSEPLGSETRDAVFTPDGDTILLARADEGIRPVPVGGWRELDGRDLLEATEAAVPRRLGRAELSDLAGGDP